MYIHKLFAAMIFLSFLFFSSAYGMDRPQEDNPYSWIPERLAHKKQEIISLVMQEKHIKIANNPSESQGRDYGYSFPQINHLQKLCLDNVSKSSFVERKRVSVIEEAAGHGFMAWKILVAGGHLTAIEKQEPTAKHLQEKVMQAKPFLTDGERVKNICVLRQGDVHNRTLDIYKKQYAISFSGNLIHLFTPEEVQTYVNNLYNIIMPGGCSYATVHSPCGQKDRVEYFLSQKKAGAKYPGFFICNRIQHYTIEGTRGRCTQVDILGPFTPAPSNMAPITITDGFYQSAEAVEFDHQKSSGTYKVRVHSAMHFFDPESLSYFFKKAGFEVADKDAFFMDNEGKKVEKELSIEEMSQNLYSVGIVARKPE